MHRHVCVCVCVFFFFARAPEHTSNVTLRPPDTLMSSVHCILVLFHTSLIFAFATPPMLLPT